MLTLTCVFTFTSLTLLAASAPDATCDDQVDGVVMLQTRLTFSGFEATGATGAAVAEIGKASDDNFGLLECPCVGIEGLPGEVTVVIEGANITYPSAVGSKCGAWDESIHPQCRNSFSGEAPPPWCSQKWCYVDPCECHLSTGPWETQGVPVPTHHGRSVYFSYTTCGETVAWKAGDDPTACVSNFDSESCFKDTTCEWTLDKGCIGKDIAGAACAATTTPAPSEKAVATDFGDQGCMCVGLANRVGTFHMFHGDIEGNFSADIGSSCKAWDQDQEECQAADAPSWCKDRWCYVDPCSCSLSVPPTRAVAGEFHGRHIYYSYDTCGNPDTFTLDTNPKACKSMKTEEDCINNGPQCTFTEWAGCLGVELATSCMEGGGTRALPALLAILMPVAMMFSSGGGAVP